MRYFLIFILGLIPFLSPAQDSTTVCIKPSTARYYLEVEDEVYVLREKDSLNTQLITNLGDQLLVKDQIIVTHENDSSLYALREATFLEQIRILTENLEDTESKLRLRKILEILAIIGIVVISIL